jgi:putative hydrolase of HD superfamily
MQDCEIPGRLAFIVEAERLKNVLRSAHTSVGRHESTAEHSWRLCLLAMVMKDLLEGLDFERVLKICVLHDLGEALHGDVPAVAQQAQDDKSARERADLMTLMGPLPAPLQQEFAALWDEYDQASTREARVVKALDKLETIIQHNQGANPPDFDYTFNLSYGRKHTAAEPLFAHIRAIVDQDTMRRAQQARSEGTGARH